MEKISNKWLKVILWVAGYLGGIVFALVGGYVYIKTDKEEIKKETKNVFIVTLCYFIVDVVIAFISKTISVFGGSVDAYNVLTIISYLCFVSKVLVYAILALHAFFNKENTLENNSTTSENNN